MNWTLRRVSFGNWRRIRGTTPKGEDDDRWHIVPVSEGAKKLIALDALGAMGHTGLCPGEILEGSEWTLAYRFISITKEVAAKVIRDLDTEIRRIL